MILVLQCRAWYDTYTSLKMPSMVPSEGQHGPGRQVNGGPILHWLVAYLFAIGDVTWQWLSRRVLNARGGCVHVCVCVCWVRVVA